VVKRPRTTMMTTFIKTNVVIKGVYNIIDFKQFELKRISWKNRNFFITYSSNYIFYVYDDSNNNTIV